jgi:hypothetical protein
MGSSSTRAIWNSREVAPLRGAVLWGREPVVDARHRPPANLSQPWRVDLNLLGLDPRRGRRD